MTDLYEKLEPFGSREGVVAGQRGKGMIEVLLAGQTVIAKTPKSVGTRKAFDLAPGDRVQLAEDGESGIYSILSRAPRKSALIRLRGDRTRRSASALEEAVLAANIDFAVIVLVAHRTKLRTAVVDRFIAMCEYGGVRPVLCINKIDLADELPDLSIYDGLDLIRVYTSATNGDGIDVLNNLLKNSISVLTGPSGVGKSSLVNALLGESLQNTGTVRESDGRGRHTTTSSTIVALDSETYIIDTPGIRSVGLAELSPSALQTYFRDFAEYARYCRFADCLHFREPGCAVKEAVSRGDIPEARYQSYVRLLADMR